ncbi:methylmalonyl-CoA epimerase [Chloroflexota bacterium]
MLNVKRIDHVAILVEDLDEAISFWRDTLGVDLTFVEDLPEEQAKVAFLPMGESEVELIKPTTEESGLAKYLAKHGPGLHHICLEVEDIDGMLEGLKEQSVHLINKTPLTGSRGERYAFIHPKGAHGVLVELYELPK